MNFSIIFLGNLLLCSIILAIFDVYPKILTSNFFNHDTKCFYVKDVEKNDLPKIIKNEARVNDEGGILLLNEKGKFVKSLLIVPVHLLLLLWPFLLFFPENIITWCFVNIIFILFYNNMLIFIRFRMNKNRILIDKDYPYYISYTLYSLNFNRVTAVFIAFYVFASIISNSMIAYVILFLLIVKLHLSIFIDKIDAYFGWNILEKNKLDNLSVLAYSISMILLAIFVFILGSNQAVVSLF